MFQTIVAALSAPPGFPPRTTALMHLAAVRDGVLYDALPFEFSDERNAAGDYIPLRQRKPSVRYGLCRLVVDDSITFLFGEGRWPAVECDDRATQDALQLVIAESRLGDTMAAAALEGSIGSVAVLFRVLKGRVFWTVMPTAMLTPGWDPEEPDALLTLTERRRVRGSDLQASGYVIAEKDLGADFWWQRIWTRAEEAWFTPRPVTDEAPLARDPERSVKHGLGFVPAVWVRNLPGSATGDADDGGCTFRLAIETSIEIDYQLSQAGRGLKYASDPTLLIKEPAAPAEGEIVRGAANALVVSEKGGCQAVGDQRLRIRCCGGLRSGTAGDGPGRRAWEPRERRSARCRPVWPRDGDALRPVDRPRRPPARVLWRRCAAPCPHDCAGPCPH